MNERTRALRDVQRTLDATTDRAALAAYASGFRPVVAKLRDLAEDATLPTGTRVCSRKYLRAEILKALRVLETRIDVAAPPEPEHGDPAGNGGAGPVS